MFQFPRFPPPPSGQGPPRITAVGLLHSGILGSLRGGRSPRSFAARPRPSSAWPAEASTACPSIGPAAPRLPGRAAAPHAAALPGARPLDVPNSAATPQGGSACPSAVKVLVGPGGGATG